MDRRDDVLLDVRSLVVALETAGGRVPLVDDVSFVVRAGETLALVGESGCGKTLTALALLRLVDPPVVIAGGEVRFGGDDVLRLPERGLRKIRGGGIAMVFQEPMTALNPVLTVGAQVDEVLELHAGLGGRRARARTVELLAEVGIADPARRADDHPHRLSGGMRQRVLVAMALAGDPRLLIADEPTTALDVTIQAQILDLLSRLQEERGMGLLLITHDLGVVAELAHRVAVMYAGRIVEEAPVADLFAAPSHPYTQGLFRSLPPLAGPRGRLAAIPGSVPAPGRFPPGCRFHPRCPEVFEPCPVREPALDGAGGRPVACFARGARAREDA